MRGFLILSAVLMTLLPASAGNADFAFLPANAGHTDLAFLPAKAGNTDLDRLFQALKSAGTTEEAHPLEDRLLNRFRQSGSPSIDILMQRADAAFSAGDKAVAMRLIAAVNGIAPTYAEGWHERAILEAEDGNDKAAIESLQKTIRLNPRHFTAMVRLGDLLQEYGDKAGALTQFRRALALDPQFEGLGRRIEALSRRVEGQGI